MTRQRMAANGRTGVTSTGAEGGKREGLGKAHLTASIPTHTHALHSPSRAILRCPNCGTRAARFDVLAGRFGDSPARCAACCRRSERRDWLRAS